MNRQELVEQIRSKQSYLCIGLDTDINKIPANLKNHPDAVFSFNQQIIDATRDTCVSYKINTAFYEALGVKGWAAMEQTIRYIGSSHFIIADAKRGDIGNTADQYAKAFFETLPCDAVTVAPYMGEDSVKPFMQYENKWAIALGLTSNQGARDFELQEMSGVTSITGKNEKLYEKVLRTIAGWGTPDNCMFVIGATQADEFINIRKILPTHFFLVPGVGTQGGSLKDISTAALISDVGLLVNVSRAIIYASDKEDFAGAARNAALGYQAEMNHYLGN